MDFYALAWLGGFGFVGCCLLRHAWSVDRNTEAVQDHADSNRQLADATNQNAHQVRLARGGKKW